MSTAAEAAAQLRESLGLSGPEIRFGLSQDELFGEAIANDRGRVDVYCGSDRQFSEPFRFVGEYATHAYFCNIMLPEHARDDIDRAEHGWTVLNVPSFPCDPERDGTRSDLAVIIDIQRRLALVLGTDTWDDPEAYDEAAAKLCDMF